jgi:trimeric autotransporter adhesin
MKNPIQLTKTIDPIQNSLRPSSWRCRALIIPLAFGLACFAISPPARAVDPPPDGGYQNQNTAEGEDALFSLDTGAGYGNTAMGFGAMYYTETGQVNAAFGVYALQFNSGDFNTGIGTVAAAYNAADYNTALGYSALCREDLYYSLTGGNNTASGAFSLATNTSGADNTASGFKALYSNTTGSDNTGSGAQALYSNTIGLQNTASGYEALYSNISGIDNTAVGHRALFLNTTASYNTAAGDSALYNNTTGAYNIASGASALLYNTSGGSNTALGPSALLNNTTGSNNVGLGQLAGMNLTTGDNNIDIANAGVAGESAKIRIGTKPTHKNTYIAGIYGVTVSRGIGVIIDNTGHLGTTTSSARFKEQIKPMEKASEAILALEPVTFRYKKELDPDQIPQFGLVAEEVAKVNPDLVARDDEGKPYTVRYEAVNAMLLNEFLKEHRKVEEQARKGQEQEATISHLKSAIAQQQKDFQSALAQQQKEIATLTSTLEEQASQIQKVSARVPAADHPAPHLAANDQLKTNR